MSLKLTDRTPVRGIEIDTEAQNPDIELNVLLDTENFSNEININELDVLKKLGFFDEYKKRQTSFPITETQGLFKLKKNKLNSVPKSIR